MPDQSPTERSAATVQSLTLIRLAAAAVALFGMTVLLAWHAHWIALLQILPNSAAIKYNTGLCFILCSGGLALLLALAHVRNRVEIQRRRRVEAQFRNLSALQKAILNAANYGIIYCCQNLPRRC